MSNRILPLLLAPVFFALLIVGLVGCDSTEPVDDFDPATAGVYVANQGSFSDANGSVTWYDPETDQAQDFVSSVGSTVQSIFLHDDRLYVLANSGNRIEAVDFSGEMTVTIPVLSPRYMVRVTDSTAFVTSLFGSAGSFTGGKVFEVDLTRNQVTDSVAVGDNPEGIAVVDTLAFVANNAFGAGSSVTVIDTRSKQVVETVDVGCDGPRFVLADDDSEVWVLCTGQTTYDDSGNVVSQTNGAIRILDAETRAVVESQDLDAPISTIGPGQDAVLARGLQQIFLVVDANKILRFDTRSNQQIAEIGPLDGDPIGGIGFDPISERLYVGRVPGFTEAGTVTIHDFQGEQVGAFTAGVAPAYIVFRAAD